MDRRRFLGLAAATGVVAAIQPEEYVRRWWAGYSAQRDAVLARASMQAQIERLVYAVDAANLESSILALRFEPQNAWRIYEGLDGVVRREKWATNVHKIMLQTGKSYSALDYLNNLNGVTVTYEEL